MATRDKNIWILILFVLAGIVVGGLLGELASGIDFLWWLRLWRKFWTCSACCFGFKYYFVFFWGTI